MLNIVICEDNADLLNLYTLFIKDYMHDHIQQNLNISLATKNPNDVVKYTKRQSVSTIYILDIGFQNATTQGIVLAEKIRKTTINSAIIFITTHENLKTLALEIKVQPWDFVVKDDGFKNIKTHLTKDIGEIYEQFKTEKFHYTIAGRAHTISFDKINYFEVTSYNKRVITLHTNTSEIQFLGNLADIELTSDQFVRIQKGILVSIRKISGIDASKSTITLENETLPVDKRYFRNILEKL